MKTLHHLVKSKWLNLVGGACIAVAVAAPAQAADREDVVAGVVAGTALGYLLSESNGSTRITYRDGGYHHGHTYYVVPRYAYPYRHGYSRHNAYHYRNHHGKSWAAPRHGHHKDKHGWHKGGKNDWKGNRGGGNNRGWDGYRNGHGNGDRSYRH